MRPIRAAVFDARKDIKVIIPRNRMKEIGVRGIEMLIERVQDKKEGQED